MASVAFVHQRHQVFAFTAKSPVREREKVKFKIIDFYRFEWGATLAKQCSSDDSEILSPKFRNLFLSISICWLSHGSPSSFSHDIHSGLCNKQAGENFATKFSQWSPQKVQSLDVDLLPTHHQMQGKTSPSD